MLLMSILNCWYIALHISGQLTGILELCTSFLMNAITLSFIFFFLRLIVMLSICIASLLLIFFYAIFKKLWLTCIILLIVLIANPFFISSIAFILLSSAIFRLHSYFICYFRFHLLIMIWESFIMGLTFASSCIMINESGSGVNYTIYANVCCSISYFVYSMLYAFNAASCICASVKRESTSSFFLSSLSIASGSHMPCVILFAALATNVRYC